MKVEEIFIISDPEICHGKPVIKGTRVRVNIIVEMLKSGFSPKYIHEEYPSVPLDIIVKIAEKLKRGERLLAEVRV